jgi:hypothetical protein
MISSQEETDTNNAQEEVGKEDTQGDPDKGTDKGKSSHAFSAENPVTLHVIADRNNGPTKDQVVPLETYKYQYALDKSAKRKPTSEWLTTEVSLTIGPHNNAPMTGCRV